MCHKLDVYIREHIYRNFSKVAKLCFSLQSYIYFTLSLPKPIQLNGMTK